MTLEDAVKQFEANFRFVEEWAPSNTPACYAPGTKNRFITYDSNGPRVEGEHREGLAFPTAESAIEHWLENVTGDLHRSRMSGKGFDWLRWRRRPELESGQQSRVIWTRPVSFRKFGPIMHTVTSRMLFDTAPGTLPVALIRHANHVSTGEPPCPAASSAI